MSDTTYSLGPLGGATLTLSADPNDFFIAIGVNHEAAGKATCENVIVQNRGKQAGVAHITSREMGGSAERFLPAHPDAKKLFAIKVARQCEGEKYCVEVPTEFPGVGLDEHMIFAFRCYLQPGFTVSSVPEELVTERVLHFLP